MRRPAAVRRRDAGRVLGNRPLLVRHIRFSVLRALGGGRSRTAALDWFARAGRGLGVRYGVYSGSGKGEFAQFHDKIPPAEYTKLKHGFDASGFDAARLADLALVCGARYVNFSARGPDGFCLFRTNTTDFTSLNSPARRDLVEETAAACRTRGLVYSSPTVTPWIGATPTSSRATAPASVGSTPVRPTRPSPRNIASKGRRLFPLPQIRPPPTGGNPSPLRIARRTIFLPRDGIFQPLGFVHPAPDLLVDPRYSTGRR